MARKVLIQLRRDTAANWTSTNPTLASGEAGYETDTGKLKIGDGVTAWTSLAYFGGSGGVTSLDSITGAVSLIAGSNVTITDNSPSAGDITIAASGGGGSGGVVGFGSQSADVATAGTTYATGHAVLTSDLSFTADGSSSYMVQLLGPSQKNSNGTASNQAWVKLDGSQSVFLMYNIPGSLFLPVSGVNLITPSAGSHTLNAVLVVSAGTGTLLAGTSLTTGNILVVVTKL